MNPSFDVMVVSSDLEFRRDLLSILSDLNCDPLCVPGIQQAKDLLREVHCGLVFSDCTMCYGTYRELLLAVRTQKSKARVVVVSRLHNWGDYLLAMKLGAFDLIGAPCRPTDVEWMLLQTHRNYRDAYPRPASNIGQNSQRAEPAAQ